MKAKPSDAKEILDLLLGKGGTQRDNPNRVRRSLDAFALLSLPEDLRKTAYAIHKTGRATAMMIAGITGGKVENEMSNLRELEEMGYLEAEEIDQNIFFSIVL